MPSAVFLVIDTDRNQEYCDNRKNHDKRCDDPSCFIFYVCGAKLAVCVEIHRAAKRAVVVRRVYLAFAAFASDFHRNVPLKIRL